MSTDHGRSAVPRRLLLLAIALTLVALIGLALTVGDPGASLGLVRYVLVPMYVLGALLLLAAGLRWLVQFTRRDRDDQPPDQSHS